MFIFAVVAFAASITSDDDYTPHKWSNMVASSASLSLVSIGILFSKHATAIAFRVATVGLGVIAGVASMIVSGIDAYKVGDDFAMWLNVVGVVGSGAATVGFVVMIMAAGVITSVIGGIGVFLLILGIVLAFGASVWLFMRDFLKENSEIAFESMRKILPEKRGCIE